MLIDGQDISELVSKHLIELLLSVVFRSSASVSVGEVRRFALDRSPDAGTRLSPTLSFLVWLGVLARSGEALVPNETLGQLSALSTDERRDEIARRFLERF